MIDCRTRVLTIALAAVLAAGCAAALSEVPPAAATAPRPAAAIASGPIVDATTLEGKLIVGYQGWFACPGDGSPLGAWEHWFRRGHPAGPASLRVDMWPDVSELDPDERCPTPLTRPDGRPAEVYSAYDPRTVARHFRWMREYDLPGVFLQRFTAHLDDHKVREFRDAVLRNVRDAAESHGRVFAVMYDISGHQADVLVDAVKRDWTYLVHTLRVTESSRYLRHRGRPVVALWGFGFTDRPGTPEQAAELIAFFKDEQRVTLVGGVPAHWRTLTGDSQSDPGWARVYRAFDVVSPWTVGRFRDARGIDRFYATRVVPDRDETRRLGIDYLPVVYPGFSWRNMNPDAPLNEISRRGGRFFWHQVRRALGAGQTMLYGAMFDEVDEGTALFKLAPTPREAPVEVPIVTLDADGHALPSDWYLRLAREAQERLAELRRTKKRRATHGESGAQPRPVHRRESGM